MIYHAFTIILGAAWITCHLTSLQYMLLCTIVDRCVIIIAFLLYKQLRVSIAITRCVSLSIIGYLSVSVCLSVYRYLCTYFVVPICFSLDICMFIYLLTAFIQHYLPIWIIYLYLPKSVYMKHEGWLSTHSSIYPSIHVSICLSVRLPVFSSVCFFSAKLPWSRYPQLILCLAILDQLWK